MASLVHFDCFDVDIAAGLLFRHGARVRLRDQSFRVLEMLLEHPGEVITREDLRRRLWPGDVFVEFENSLNTAVGRLREALGDSAERPRFIETLPRRGYRFIAKVSEGPADPPSASAAADGSTAGNEPRRTAASRRRPDGTNAYDPITYSEYVQGHRRLDVLRNGEDAEKAREHFERAVARDPGFALAHQGLAEFFWTQGYLGLMPPKDAVAAGVLHAVRALEIDDTRGETHALLAQFHKQLDFNWPEIERELSSAVRKDPDSSLVRILHAVSWLMPQGRIEEAITELESVLARDPLSTRANQWLGVMLALARDWDRLAAHSRAMMDLDPTSPWGPWLFAAGCRAKGLVDDAIAANRRAVDLSGGWPFMLGWLGLLLGGSGRHDEARAILDRLGDMARTMYVPPTSFAWISLGLGEADRAFEWLDRAVDTRDQLMMPIKTYAFLDPIRADPRFAVLLGKMKLA